MKLLPFALLAPLLILPLAAFGQTPGVRLKARQLARAEQLLSELEQFDATMNSGPGTAQFKARAAKLSNNFTRNGGGLPESNIKTDLATAVYWYEQLALNLNHSTAARPHSVNVSFRCQGERPGIYQRLCECASGSTRDLLWAKARLHLSWARAAINFEKTGTIDRPLDDVAVERKIDQMLAARVVESLKILESKVLVYRSLGDFERSGKIARVSLADFKKDLQKLTLEAEGSLAWLPQNLLKSELSNSLHSFADGAYWWEQIDQPRVVRVSEMAARDLYVPAPQAALLTTIPYTVVVHWRHGSVYLQHAEQLLAK
jgi:hypothetical protein